MSFTIYCCGTSSNSFDALGDMEREVDEWDKKPKEFEELWKKGQSEDLNVRNPARAKLNEIYEARRATVKLRKNYGTHAHLAALGRSANCEHPT
jgi:hypothetical protein